VWKPSRSARQRVPGHVFSLYSQYPILPQPLHTPHLLLYTSFDDGQVAAVRMAAINETDVVQTRRGRALDARIHHWAGEAVCGQETLLSAYIAGSGWMLGMWGLKISLWCLLASHLCVPAFSRSSNSFSIPHALPLPVFPPLHF
jgi:hypothetical protein